MPPDAGPAQIQEMRRAFFAGARSMLAIMQDVGDDDVSEDAGVIVLQEALEECQEFNEGIRDGKF